MNATDEDETSKEPRYALQNQTDPDPATDQASIEHPSLTLPLVQMKIDHKHRQTPLRQQMIWKTVRHKHGWTESRESTKSYIGMESQSQIWRTSTETKTC